MHLAEINPASMKAPGGKVTKGSSSHHSLVSEITMHDAPAATYSAVNTILVANNHKICNYGTSPHVLIHMSTSLERLAPLFM